MQDNPKQWVDDDNRKILNLPVKGAKEEGKTGSMCVDLFICIGGEQFRSTKRSASDLGQQHPMKQEITRFTMFYVPAYGRTSAS